MLCQAPNGAAALWIVRLMGENAVRSAWLLVPRPGTSAAGSSGERNACSTDTANAASANGITWHQRVMAAPGSSAVGLIRWQLQHRPLLPAFKQSPPG